MNTKLKCLLLDDELPGLTYLKMLCEIIPELEIIGVYNNPDLFIKEIPELEFDLCIMDIEMPGMNGLQVANLLKGKPVIFTTGYSQYAAEAFDLDAIDYVRKPIKLDRLKLAVKKALLRTGKSLALINSIRLNTDKGKSLINTDQIGYIATSETDSRDKVAYLLDGSSLVLKNISIARLLAIVPSGQFCQVNKKELTALRSIHFFSHDTITTNIIQSDGKPVMLYLTETYRKEFIQLVQL